MSLRGDRVTMAHGGGGRAMRDLIDEVFTCVFQPPGSEDQARLMADALQEPGARLAFTTDSFVVTPLEFPGGDIGKLAVCGTVNDLAVGGARPLWLSAAFIIEEGTEIALGWQAAWVLLLIRFGARLFRRNVLKSGGGKRGLIAGLFARS